MLCISSYFVRNSGPHPCSRRVSEGNSWAVVYHDGRQSSLNSLTGNLFQLRAKSGRHDRMSRGAVNFTSFTPFQENPPSPVCEPFQGLRPGMGGTIGEWELSPLMKS